MPERKDTLSDSILSMVYRPMEDRSTNATSLTPQVDVIMEGAPTFQERILSQTACDPAPGQPHILVGYLFRPLYSAKIEVPVKEADDRKSQLEPESLWKSSKGLDYVSSQMKSCYYSSIKTGKSPSLGELIWYNLKEVRTVNSQDLRVGPQLATLVRLHEPIYSKYKFSTGQMVYLVSMTNYPEWGPLNNPQLPRIHPFSIHLTLLFQEIQTRGASMKDKIRTLVDLEERLLFDPQQGELEPSQIDESLRDLHQHARFYLVCMHRNGRDITNISNLLRDLERFSQEIAKHPDYFQLDTNLQERVKDGFLSLLDTCNNITRRLENRQGRIQNMIALLYNLLANRNSSVTLKIAATNADIARESMATNKESAHMARESAALARELRRDSATMKTLAYLGMLYLPGTFVSGWFGTNFFALSLSDPGHPKLVVSPLWWIYLVTVLPLTLLTIGVCGWWMWYRKRQEEIAAVGLEK